MQNLYNLSWRGILNIEYVEKTVKIDELLKNFHKVLWKSSLKQYKLYELSVQSLTLGQKIFTFNWKKILKSQLITNRQKEIFYILIIKFFFLFSQIFSHLYKSLKNCSFPLINRW